MFATAYKRQHRQDNRDISSWTSKSLKCVTVGSCPNSDGLLFYHPPSKQLLTCGDGYRFDTYSPAGPQFGQTYEGDFKFTTKSAIHNIHQRPSHELNSTAYIKVDDTIKKVTILDIPTDKDEDLFTVQEIESGDIHQLLQDKILDHDPTANPIQAQQNQSNISRISMGQEWCKSDPLPPYANV